jgi:hypothetical protein
MASLPAMVAGILSISLAAAQIAPPSTIYGSVTDADGPIDAGVPIEAYVGTLLCGTGKTEFTGDGAARVTVYFVNVSSREDKPGCGSADAEVRIKLGDRFVAKTARWQAGPVEFNITFGNVTPAPIPTFTPTPRQTATPAPGATTQPATQATASGTTIAGSPGAGSPVPTLRGGVTSATPETTELAMTAGNSDGFPLWAAIALVLGGIAAIGGGIGYVMSRNHDRDDGDDIFSPRDDDQL